MPAVKINDRGDRRYDAQVITEFYRDWKASSGIAIDMKVEELRNIITSYLVIRHEKTEPILNKAREADFTAFITHAEKWYKQKQKEGNK